MFSRILASVDGAGGAVNKTKDIVNKRPDKKTASETTGGVENRCLENTLDAAMGTVNKLRMLLE